MLFAGLPEVQLAVVIDMFAWTLLLALAAACGVRERATENPALAGASGGAPPIAGQIAPPMTTGASGQGAGMIAQPIAGMGVAGVGGTGGVAGTEVSGGAGGAGGMSAEDCRGFSFDGLVYSPGGDVLPNKCMPFHPTTNNPYAVRCVDAWPWYATEFPGDDFCILPPDPDKGVQYGVHPQGREWFAQVSTAT